MVTHSELESAHHWSVACADSSREFVEEFREPRGGHEKAQLKHVRAAADRLEDDHARHEKAVNEDVLKIIGAAISGQSLPFIAVAGKSYVTAHEGAAELAKAIINAAACVTCCPTAGMEHVRELCQRLQDFGHVPDLKARLEAEFFAAEKSLSVVLTTA